MKKTNRPASDQKLSLNQKRVVAFLNRRRGDVTKVSQKTGFAMSTVSEVLSGLYNNTRIVNAAYEMARHRKGAKIVDAPIAA